jgi:hypothetical protein
MARPDVRESSGPQPFCPSEDRATGPADRMSAEDGSTHLMHNRSGTLPAERQRRCEIGRMDTRSDVFTVYAAPSGQSLDLDVGPRLVSWNRKDHTDQRQNRIYLQSIRQTLSPLLETLDAACAIHLAVGLPPGIPLTEGGRDLDNYLYLLVCEGLGSDRFLSVSASKEHGKSRITVGAAVETMPPGAPVWTFADAEPAGSYTRLSWKQDLAAQIGRQAQAVTDGPIEMQISFRLGLSRQWASLWKPAIDSLACILGDDPSGRPFHPRDDRIVRLALHRAVDPTLGNRVQIGVWWRKPVEARPLASDDGCDPPGEEGPVAGHSIPHQFRAQRTPGPIGERVSGCSRSQPLDVCASNRRHPLTI